MRTFRFASLASLFLGASLALTGCQVGGDDGGGDDNNGGTPDAGPGGGPADAAPAAEPCLPSVEDFESDVFDVALTACVGCHSGGPGGFTITADNMAGNLTEAEVEAKKKNAAGVSVLLVKPTGGGGHQGGALFAAGSPQYLALEKFVNQANGTGGVCP